LFGCTVAASASTRWKNGKKYAAAKVNNSLTLNLIVCQKRQRILRRISLLKRKAQHRGNRVERNKNGKVKKGREPGVQHWASFYAVVGVLI
jgi:hypothetical protein